MSKSVLSSFFGPCSHSFQRLSRQFHHDSGNLFSGLNECHFERFQKRWPKTWLKVCKAVSAQIIHKAVQRFAPYNPKISPQ